MNTPSSKFGPNRVYEVMTRLTTNYGTMRVWSRSNDLRFGPDPELVERVRRIERDVKAAVEGEGIVQKDLDPRELFIEGVSHLTGVEAVELVDAQGNGALIYPDWG